MSILIVFKVLSSLLFFAGEGAVLFESIESKTAQGKPVFNIIELEQTRELDIWKMKQSHNGVKSHNWDNIQIVVNKSSRPFKVSYHQLDSEGREIEYKTSCFRCHSGGPRLIRPRSLRGINETLAVKKWNWLIKSYGDMELVENNPFIREIPFVEDQKLAREKLNIKSCTSCHYRGGPRSPLTRSQALTIKHLVKQGQMPPWPYSISKKEKAELKKFIYGF